MRRFGIVVVGSGTRSVIATVPAITEPLLHGSNVPPGFVKRTVKRSPSFAVW